MSTESPGYNIDKVIAEMIAERDGKRFALTHATPGNGHGITCCNGCSHYYREFGQVFICCNCYAIIPVPRAPAFDTLRYGGNGKSSSRGGRKRWNGDRKGLFV